VAVVSDDVVEEDVDAVDDTVVDEVSGSLDVVGLGVGGGAMGLQNRSQPLNVSFRLTQKPEMMHLENMYEDETPTALQLPCIPRLAVEQGLSTTRREATSAKEQHWHQVSEKTSASTPQRLHSLTHC